VTLFKKLSNSHHSIITFWLFEVVQIYGIFVRLLGLLFVFQFATTFPQLLPLIGKRGIEPISYLIHAFRRDHGILLGFFKLPTLLWISSTDIFIQLLPIIGIFCGLLVTTGFLGGYNSVAIFGCWFIWLSIVNSDTNVFGIPWDNLLLEAALWAMFLPGLKPLPELAMLLKPHPWIHVGFVILLFRVMFGMGFAKFKSPDERTREGTYIFHFLQWQPMATSSSIYLRELPIICHKMILIVLFIVEVSD